MGSAEGVGYQMGGIAFVSCNETPWGGSEELWARAALHLSEQGYEVAVAKPRIDRRVEPIRRLRERGVRLVDLARLPMVPSRVFVFLNFAARMVMFAFQLFRLWTFLWREKPDLVVLSQGGCWDGFFMEPVLRRRNARYVLICQKASDLYWPPDSLRDRVRDFVRGADAVFAVSRHNLTLLGEQIGEHVANGKVVRNPFLVDYAKPLPWPGDSSPARFACIGRLYPMEKGQDLLLRVLAMPKWRDRDLTVDFFGEGTQRRGLEEMARLLGCRNVAFHGHVDDIEQVWESRHGLILPSRAEGLPLVLVETMLAGRVAVISNAGGSAEIVEDGQTAFVMRGGDEAALDDALERAWQRRADWPLIAERAARAVREHVPPSPAAEMAQEISALVSADRLVG